MYVYNYIKNFNTIFLNIFFCQKYLKFINFTNLSHITSIFFSFLNYKNNIFLFSFFFSPTPALCGVKKKKSLLNSFIIDNLNRDFYCGFCGILSKRFNFFLVLIRFFNIFLNKISLFSGAGIVFFSNKNTELFEINNKMYKILFYF